MKNEHIDLLDAYFAGTLDEQGQEEFDKRLNIDPAFKELYSEYNDLHMGIDYSTLKITKKDLQQLEASLPEVDHQPSNDRPIISMFKGHYWQVAAAVLVLAVSAVAVVNYQQSKPGALYTKNFEPYANEFVNAERGKVPTNELLLQGFQAYDREDYPSAIANFNIVLEEDKENLMVLFYLGNAQMANHENQAAIATFKKFLDTSTGDFTTEAKWYLALAHMKEGHMEEAIHLLREIEHHYEFGSPAQKLLRKLE